MVCGNFYVAFYLYHITSWICVFHLGNRDNNCLRTS